MENCSPEEIHLDRGDRPVRTGGDSLEFTRWGGGDRVKDAVEGVYKN